MNSLKTYPKHIAIIMDGNGRWAKKHNLPTIAGHKAGITALEKIIKCGIELKIEYMTFFAFSSENWKREKSWLNDFNNLLRWYLKTYTNKLIKDGIRINIIGNLANFDKDIQLMLKTLEINTKNNNVININVALGYGARDEMTRAIKQIVSKVENKELTSNEITEAIISQNLDTSFCPDPDILIRTSGEIRISNFLLWQIAYSELFFFQELWPDFTQDHLIQAVESYLTRDRRFGGTDNYVEKKCG